MRSSLRFALIALVLAAAAVVASAPAGAYTSQFTEPIAFDVTNPCNGENVSLSGTWHEVVHQSGGAQTTTFVGIDEFHLTGLGDATGARYESNQTIPFQYTFQNDGVLETILVDRVELVGDGSAPNFTLTQLDQVTFDANGRFTHDTVRFETSCAG
jgi:hypothetical protein